MKIGLFSDVHGHLNELYQTLDLLQSHQVDKIVCMGDLVNKGSDSDAVVRVIRNNQIDCVAGNHDTKAKYGWFSYNEPITGQTLHYLNQLPDELRYQWAGISVYICHANPWQDSSFYIFPTRPTILFEQVAEAVPEQIIIMGHTHHPMRVDISDKVLLNPGSVYANRDRPQRTCAILTLPQLDFQLFDIDTGNLLTL